MPSPQWAPVDDATADLLTEVAAAAAKGTYPSKADQWTTFVRALRAVAFIDGVISQNEMREHITGKVEPQRTGPFYREACRIGLTYVLADQWETSTDKRGKNAGRPCRMYGWSGEAL